ncbi:MAG: choice-of-anchor J domain-containing protein, partial [Muribaculaceae bacterium]|nr:choice-of-anchor J domain-containing protein [Muribaculaceae bacterium]
TIDIVGGTQYDITCNQPQHGTISAPAQAYANSTVTLTATPETGYCLSGWDVRDASNNSIAVNGNQFTMPESNVTVTATFIQGMAVTLASVTNGTISADPSYALQGNTINLTATPASGYNFDGWVVYKTGDVNTTVAVTGNSFTMPDYPVTISAFFSLPQGGEVTIGSGTTTSSDLPTNVWYSNTTSQQIYTAAEIGESGTITAISFNYNGNATSGERTIDIYMSHTTSSTITTWVTESSSHLVYSGTKTFTDSGWYTFTLDTPFAYNGTNNILITVNDHTGSYVGSSGRAFYIYSTGSSRAIYYRNDYNNQDPLNPSSSYSATSVTSNSQIKITKETPSTEASLSVSPSSLTGFETIAGSVASNPQCVTVIGNNLQANLTVTAPSGYEVSTAQNGSYASTLTLTPSSGNIRANVFVRLNSNTPGTFNGNLIFASGSANATVTLSGTVIPGSGAQHTISVAASPANGGTVSGGGVYYESTTCTLTATPAEHYTFGGWQLGGSVVSTDNPYSFTVTGNADYTAVFNEMPKYNVTINQVEGGSISANPTLAYPGEVVNLTVTTNNGYFFVEWDVRDGSNQSIVVTNDQFTMPNSNVTVTAVFSQGFTVTLEQTPNGTISADQTQQLQPGDVVTLTATPDNGCVFLAWYVYKTGDPRAVISVVNDSWFFMPSSDVTVQAIFVTEEEHEQTIGSGSNTSSYLPTYVYRRNICHSLTQQIYTAAEIGYNGKITAIAFKASGSATRTIDVYMAHTDKTAFSSTTDWEVMGSVAKVFSGSVSFSSSWTTITLDTPFEYDGTSNLNICVVDKTSSQVSSTRTFSAYSTNANRALYAYSTGSSATDYSSVVGYSNQLESTTGTYSTSNNQIKFTIKVPGSAESITVSSGDIIDLSYEEGQGPSSTNKFSIVGVDLSNDITVTAPTNFEVCLTENGTFSSSVTITPETSKRNRSVTTWDFEDGLQGWTIVDVDGDGYNWAHSTDFEGHDGSTGLVFSQSYDNSAGVLNPDNWLISPQVVLGGSFSMWAHPQQAAYPAEHFAILVSTTNTDVSSFTLLGEWTLTSGDWKQFSVDLSAFSGQNGYIAVRHFNCSDQFYINVDDFVLDTDASITIEMPVTITPATVYVRLKDNLDAGDYNGTLTVSAGTGNNLNGSINLSGTVTRSNYWTPMQVGPNTMTVIAQVQLDGVPVAPRSQWELGAFCGTECRGSVIGLDDEPVFFLTVYG